MDQLLVVIARIHSQWRGELEEAMCFEDMLRDPCPLAGVPAVEMIVIIDRKLCDCGHPDRQDENEYAGVGGKPEEEDRAFVPS